MPRPISTAFASDSIVFAAGCAIFHLPTSRVVIIHETGRAGHFLPKGRRDAGEETQLTAIREGFEESGYRCRLLPLEIPHRQPGAHRRGAVIEPLWTELMPAGRGLQYVLCWYAAETLPPPVEHRANLVVLGHEGSEEELARTTGFAVPEAWGEGMTITQRIQTEEGEPVKHEGTGVNEEEERYVSELVDIETAKRLLRGTVMERVVGDAWEIISKQRRREGEEAARR